MLALPTRDGWTVNWYTGKVSPRTRKMKDGTRKVIGQIRWQDSFCSTSREACEAKAEALKKEGYEVIGIYKCIF